MRITLSIPDQIARRFQSAVPPRKRSRVVAELIATELKRKDDALEAACEAASRDTALDEEIAEWQSFEDGLAE